MTFELPALPYSNDALAPTISAQLMDLHYGKHHQGYVTKLNKAVDGTPMAKQSLEEIIKATANDAGKKGVFNNAAQVWNHSFFWNCMKPGGGGEPSGPVADKIKAKWGSYDKFREEFSTKAATVFGSGWCWLVKKGDDLDIVQTSNAGNPMTDGMTPLMTIDVWEHAYYLDYQNRRPDFIKAFFDKLVNWEFVSKNM